MIYLIIVLFVVLLALVLRFVQPELIYSFRQGLVKIGMNKVHLDDEGGRSGLSPRYHELLIKDLRFETLGHDSVYALKRVNKIRELYSTLDLERFDDLNSRMELRPHVCIVELASLLKNLAEHMTPEKHIRYPTVKADQILRIIGNEINSIQDTKAGASEAFQSARVTAVADANWTGGPLANNSAVEKWFRENPMSIEQTIEILIAAVFGLAYRQRTAETYELHRSNGSMLVTN